MSLEYHSSDSEDCYGNVAQKLQSIKSKCEVPMIQNVKSIENEEQINDCVVIESDTKAPQNVLEETNISLNDSEEIDLDIIIAQNSKTRPRRSTQKAKNIAKTRNGKRAADTETAERSTRGRILGSTNTVKNSISRGSSRRRSRPNKRTTIECLIQTVNSVGNTDEYPDKSDSVELFKQTDNVICVEEDPLEDIEELSVKVYWQSTEIVKFNLRKYQKFTTMYEYFSKKQNVPIEKLFFTYNDMIFSADDTPDSIDYNIGRFIEGGILNRDVTKLVKKSVSTSMRNGVRLKFQCMKLKKPYEAMVGRQESIHIAMVKFSEHVEVELCKLKFYFDGDQINGKPTPEELDLENGDCIDVKVMD